VGWVGGRVWPLRRLLLAGVGRVVGVAHQRCRVHFARNLLALVPKSHQDMVAAVFRTIFAQPDPTNIASTWDQVRDQLAGRFPKIAVLMDDAKTEVRLLGVPAGALDEGVVNQPARAAQQRGQATRPRRGHLPDRSPVIRLVGAVLADVHDEWQAGDRRYLSEGPPVRWRGLSLVGATGLRG
jgi:putative transposase